ncbi:venom protease-like isoform X2 [Planococcus citri]|uniref:venom protease-like isoform X2 n=1 Tax=Planococcus citri TaxID=170843 RepID=UPI0031F8895B
MTADFIRKSRCGMENNSPKICCSHSDLRKPHSFYPTRAWITSPSWITKSSSKPTSVESTNRNAYSFCGKSTKIMAKIIGGKSTTPGDWPWMAAIGFRYPSKPRPEFLCGGTLISDTWILTAGHCVRSVGKSTQTVARVGEIDLTKDSATDMPAEEIIVHPQFTFSPLLNDIALLRLRNPVTFTAKIRPICLPKLNEYKNDKFYANKSASIAGWGYTRSVPPSNRSNILLEAQVDMVDQKTCISKFKLSPLKSLLIDDRVLCAGRRYVDSCQGDSGGPLVLSVSASYYLIGIVSYGIGCASPFYPGIYTKVAYFLDWIKYTTGIEF